MNNVVLIGRLTRDPELRHTQGGQSVCNFTLAIDKQLSKEKKQEMEAKNQPTADFINIVAWGRMAETSAQYLVKGRLVAVQGRLQSGSYEKEGVRHYTTDVVANQVQFLEWGDSQESQGNQNKSDEIPVDGFHPVDNSDIPF